MNKAVVVMGLIFLGVAQGCMPTLQAARKVGNKENATWVFIAADKSEAQGIYRCKETEDGPICTKAKMK